MSKIVSELLDEVEQLEDATQNLEAQTDSVKQKAEQVSSANAKVNQQAQLIALETAKVAQEAAQESQKAAAAAIKQADQYKAQVIDLSDSNQNWRKSLRTSVDDFKSTKSTITKMVVFVTIISFCMIGAAGYLLYASKKQAEMSKGELLDILSTENALLKKSMTLKIDELASVIENLSLPEHGPAHLPVKATAQTSSEAKSDNPQVNNSTLVWLEENGISKDQWQQLEAELIQIKAHISSLTETSANSTKTAEKTNTTLTTEQTKALKDLSYLVRRQSKSIAAINAQVKKLQYPTASSKQTLQAELDTIKLQQVQLNAELIKVQKELKILTDLAKQPVPYSYRAK